MAGVVMAMDVKTGASVGVGAGAFILVLSILGGGTGTVRLDPATLSVIETVVRIGGLPVIILFFWFLDRRNLIKAIEDQNHKLIGALTANVEAITAFRTYAETANSHIAETLATVAEVVQENSSALKILLDRKSGK